MAPIDIFARQSSSSGSSGSSGSCVGGGGIAGIVLGSIVGTLLIIWLIKTCFLPGAPGNKHPDTSDVVYSQTVPTRRRRRDYRAGPDYIEKPRSRSRRGSDIRVQRPERIYVS